MALPDFLVIGAPKAGTTALHAALARHPALYMSPVKEPKFFLTDGPPPTRRRPRRRADLPGARLAAGRTTRRCSTPRRAGALRGESTPFYLYDRAAQRRIRDADPGRQDDRDPARPGRAGALELDPPVVGGPGAGRRLRPGLRRGGRAGSRRAGPSSGTTPRLGRYGEQLEHLYLVPPGPGALLRYRALVDAPAADAGRDLRVPRRRRRASSTEVPRENVTAHPARRWRHRPCPGCCAGGRGRRPAPARHRRHALTEPLERFLQRNAGRASR